METKRVRKPNFSAAECALILQLAEENIDVIRDKFSNTITNKRKNEIWQGMCDRVNALGVSKRTPNDLREKWRAMCGEARKEYGNEKSSQRKTGGGKLQRALKPTSQRIIELFGDEPGFSGIQGGIESGTTINLDDVNEESLEVDISDVFVNLGPAHPAISEVPPSFVETLKAPISAKSVESQAKKKRKVTSHDIQKAQLDVLVMEKQKITIEIENMKLLQEKLRLEVAELRAKAHTSFNLIE